MVEHDQGSTNQQQHKTQKDLKFDKANYNSDAKQNDRIFRIFVDSRNNNNLIWKEQSYRVNLCSDNLMIRAHI
jgi:hypothetical protein